MDKRIDSIEWSRLSWQDSGQPEPDHFAAMASIMRLHQIVSSALDRLLREQDLSRTAYLVLVTLQLTSSKSLPMSQLGRNLILHPTTISLTVDQLQQRGLVARKPHPSDRRTTLAALTPEGDRILTSVNKSVGGDRYGLNGVSDRLAITLTEVIRQVRNGLGDF
jgi:DNA-binding MarR family transcriptional regulator